MSRAVFFALRLDPCIAVMLDDLLRHQVHVLLGHGIVEAPADQALDGEEGVFRIGDGLTLGRLAHEALVSIGERDHRRRRARALGILDDLEVLAVHDRHTGIRRAEVYTAYLSQSNSPLRTSKQSGQTTGKDT